MRILMKILQVCTILDPRKGGAPVTAFETFKHLGPHANNKMLCLGESTEFARRFLYSSGSYKKNNVFFMSRHKSNDHGHLLNFSEMKTLWNFIKESDVVIIHQVFNITLIITSILCKLIGRKYVVMPH